MKKETLIRWYRKMNCSEMYILGFIRKHRVYLIHYDGEIPPRYIRYCQASRGFGGQIRFDPIVKYKDQLIKRAQLVSVMNQNYSLLPARIAVNVLKNWFLKWQGRNGKKIAFPVGQPVTLTLMVQKFKLNLKRLHSRTNKK